MKRIVLIASIVLIVVGVVAMNLAARAEYVTAEGRLVESMWTPVGALLVVLGVVALIVVGIANLVAYLRNRSKR